MSGFLLHGAGRLSGLHRVAFLRLVPRPRKGGVGFGDPTQQLQLVGLMVLSMSLVGRRCLHVWMLRGDRASSRVGQRDSLVVRGKFRCELWRG
jgi:hypothetical protein